MIRRSLRQIVTALVLLVAFVSQGTWALAGTTGGLTGTVLDATSSAPIAGAVVTVSAPSQTSSVTTDASGRFGFLTLAPDTYTVSVVKANYQTTSVPGQIVFADSVQTLSVRLPKSLSTIAHVTATGAGSLVKSGTTADVYSVNAAGQAAASALGGGGSLNSAYSAIATVPGAYVIPNQTGYYQTIHIRGGDYDQVGYEFDGVPVNRSFDNYPSSSASSLGNSEVQVYTGANPANSEGQGLAGYINQVIRTGSYPGFADAQLGVGTPNFYHRAAVEVGGATPDRLFSYYVGVGGYNQAYDYVTQQNGSQYSNWVGAPLSPMNNASIAGGGYNLGPFNYAALEALSSRDVVMNAHFAIPHHNDGGRDDIQVLWDSSSLFNTFYNSTNDIASAGCSGAGAANGTACANAIGLGTPTYLDGFQWNCPNHGQTFSSAAALSAQGSCVGNYMYPSSVNRTATFTQCDIAGTAPASACAIPASQGDSSYNNQEIVKLQYTKNFGSSAFLRVYGYSYYSNWLLYGPNSTYADYVGVNPPDYELNSHTRGASVQFQDQINAQNLVSLQGSYTTANSIRDNNTQMVNFTGARSEAFVAVNAADPYSGLCYNATGAVSCNPGNAGTPAGATFAQWGQVNPSASTVFGSPAALPGSCPDPKTTSTTCAYLLAESSHWATYNAVQPAFGSLSLTDEFRPTDKWLFNLGIRLDSFTFNGDNTNTGPARQFWYNAYNQDTCLNNVTKAPIDKTSGLDIPVTSACPTGYSAVHLTNAPADYTFNVWQPRISGTYTVNPDTVLRFSYGRYTQAPNSAFEQYDALHDDVPFEILGSFGFVKFGRYSPGYQIAPPTSINYDASLEQRIHGTDWSFKLTPFLRQTQDQIQQFFLDQKTGFVSGLNVGSQRSQGVEFQLQKGDFSKNGLAGLLSFAYTNSYVKYGLLSNGTTIISPINTAIGQYNSYTKACAPGGSMFGKSQFGQPLCAGTTTGVAAGACYKGNAVVACSTPGSYQNPYWNATGQGLLDPNQQFPTYDIFPQGIGSAADSYGSPYVAVLLLNYKHDRFAITPSFQFQGGGKYGSPESNPGIDPAAGCGTIQGTQRYNASYCNGTIPIPDTYTGTFDNLGSFTQPNSIAMNMQLSYDVSPRVTLTGTLANIFNTCFGGTKAPWTFQNDGNICGYGIVGAGAIPPVGNVYNPVGSATGSIIQPFQKYPYSPIFGPYNDNNNSTKTPFNFYLSAKIKL